jgi:hypothetical protein
VIVCLLCVVEIVACSAPRVLFLRNRSSDNVHVLVTDASVFNDLESSKLANEENEKIRQELAEQQKQNENMQMQVKELRSKCRC